VTDSPHYQRPADPLTPALAEQTWRSYQQTLAKIGSQPDGMERLSALLTEVSAQLQLEQRQLLTQTLSDYTSTQDRLVLRSTEKAVRSPDRPAPPQAASRQPAAWELLSASRRLGPRLAQKLTLAEARRKR
jgi:hypothetical protein